MSTPRPAAAIRPTALPAARAAYRELRAYTPGAAACAVDLSDNTNLFGAPPAAARAVRDASEAAITRYPSAYSEALREALATLHGVPPACIVTGCGSDGVLDAAIRGFTEPGDRLAYHDPTFSMIPTLARVNGLEPAPIACRAVAEPPDADAMIATGARVLYFCSPNNPTGSRTARPAFEVVRDRLKRGTVAPPPLVVLDQAYAEFCEPDGVPERGCDIDEPVLVTRTLSKAYGLAGLRIGYGIAPAAIIAEIEKARGPYQVGAVAERAAVAALTADRAWVQARVAEVVELRARFSDALRAGGFMPLPSAANFVLVPVADAAGFAAVLRAADVAVRPFAGLHGIGDALRITLGPWPMLERCLEALRQVRP